MHGQQNIKISMMLAISQLLCYAAIAVVLDRKYRRNARKSREWSKKWLLKRPDFSHVNLLKELRFHPKDWHNLLRMNESTYLTLLSMVSALIQRKKKHTAMRQHWNYKRTELRPWGHNIHCSPAWTAQLNLLPFRKLHSPEILTAQTYGISPTLSI